MMINSLWLTMCAILYMSYFSEKTLKANPAINPWLALRDSQPSWQETWKVTQSTSTPHLLKATDKKCCNGLGSIPLFGNAPAKILPPTMNHKPSASFQLSGIVWDNQLQACLSVERRRSTTKAENASCYVAWDCGCHHSSGGHDEGWWQLCPQKLQCGQRKVDKCKQ